MHVVCGTNVQLTCPIRSMKTPDEVVCPCSERRMELPADESSISQGGGIVGILDFMVSAEFIAQSLNLYRHW